MAPDYRTKAIALIFLLFFIGLSIGRVVDFAEDMNHANLPSEAIAEMKRMRKLIDDMALLDYVGNGHSNQKHEPPKNGVSGGGNR